MKNRCFISLVLAMMTAALCLSSCNGVKKLKEIDVTSARIEKITPVGMRGLNMSFALGLDNPGIQLSLSEISCDIKHSGKVLGNVAVAPFTLHARTEEIYNMNADLKLGEDLTVFDVGRLLDGFTADDITVDMKIRVKLKGGISKRLSFNDIPLKKLIAIIKR